MVVVICPRGFLDRGRIGPELGLGSDGELRLVVLPRVFEDVLLHGLVVGVDGSGAERSEQVSDTRAYSLQ